VAATLAIANAHPDAPALTFGNVRGRIVTVTYTGTYATGGDSFTPAMVGLSTFVAVLPIARFIAAAGLSGVLAQYDYTNSKLALWGEDGTGVSAGLPLAQLASGAAVTGLILDVLVLGY
jgi:hypothetical protein